MARTIVGEFESREAARRAADALVGAGVPAGDILLASGRGALKVATDAILGSAVYDILQQCGATGTEVRREADQLTGWERLDPANDPPLRERAEGGRYSDPT